MIRLLLPLCCLLAALCQSAYAQTGGAPQTTGPGIQSVGQPAPASALEQARGLRYRQDYYRAIDLLNTLVLGNPAYYPAWQELALCLYALGEYDECLKAIDSAWKVGPRNIDLQNLRGFCLVNLGRRDEAADIFQQTLRAQANNRDARFGLALLEAAGGRTAGARQAPDEALGQHPNDARLLLALALVLKAENRPQEASRSLQEALRWAGDDAAVYYSAALLEYENKRPSEAIRLATILTQLQPGHVGALNILSNAHYDLGDYEKALSVMESSLLADSKNTQSWFLLGQISSAYGRWLFHQARLEEAAAMNRKALEAYGWVLQANPDDEIARLAAEQQVMATSSFEDPVREEYADWRFRRASQFRRQFLFDRAVNEFQRGLALNPYAVEGRKAYAELLRIQGYPVLYHAELDFLLRIGAESDFIKDVVEIYGSLQKNNVAASWKYDPLLNSPQRPYALRVFSVGPGGVPWHSGSDMIISRYVRELFASSTQIQADSEVQRVYGLADAFRPARTSGSDYFIMLEVQESEREIYVRAELRLSSTGTVVLSLETSRSGNDRVQAAALYIRDQIVSALPLQGRLERRDSAKGLLDLGRVHGLKVGDSLLVLRPQDLSLADDRPGYRYDETSVIAEATVTRLDDELAEISLVRRGFFDRVNPGDVLVPKPSQPAATAAAAQAPLQTPAANQGPSTASAGSSGARQLFDRLRRLF